MRLLVLLAIVGCRSPARSSDTEPRDSDPADTDVVVDTDDPVVASGPSVDDLIGLNGFIDDPTDRLAAFGNLREYHNWEWNDQGGPAYPNEQLQWSLWGGFWDFDAYYRTLHEAGTDVFPAIQGSVASLDYQMPPVPSVASTTEPASYAAHASFLFQMTARYGSVAVPDAQLKLADGQVRASGLGYLRYFEDGNEPDANWTTGDGSFLFDPDEYAAMASADYDGDQGRLGAGHGVKQADPDAKMVMAGLAGAGQGTWVANITGYLDGVLAWSADHRGGDFPADVLNVHTYCFGPDGFGVPDPRPAISPEECDLAGQLAQIDAWRDESLPDRALWITELGYDTDPNSNLRAPAIGSKSAEVVQADWLVRSALAVAESGVDRASIFVSRDHCSSPTCDGHDVQFSTSGVLKEKGDFTPKTSFWYLATFRSVLAGQRFAAVVESGDVRVDSFLGEAGGAYVVWLPTSTDATQSYSLAVPGASTARAVRLVAGSTTGEGVDLDIVGGSVTVDIGETPLIVLVDALK